MNRFLLLVPFLLASTWGFAEEAPDLDDPKVLEKILKEAVLRDTLEDRGPEKLVYQLGKQTPYTGWGKALHDNGKCAALVHVRNGKREGLVTVWHENGQKALELTFKDGKQDGLVTKWYENGEKNSEASYNKAGKKEGPYTRWHENGQKMFEGTYKDGKKEGLWTMWHDNGVQAERGTWKDGKEVKE